MDDGEGRSARRNREAVSPRFLDAGRPDAAWQGGHAVDIVGPMRLDHLITCWPVV